MEKLYDNFKFHTAFYEKLLTSGKKIKTLQKMAYYLFSKSQDRQIMPKNLKPSGRVGRYAPCPFEFEGIH